MKLNLISALLLSTAIFSSGIALANHHEAGEADSQKEQYKNSADANKDGKLTYEEYKMHNENRAKKKFDHMDANKDGTLDETELKVIHEMGNKCDHHNMHKENMQKEPTYNKT